MAREAAFVSPIVKPRVGASAMGRAMDETQKLADIEALARIAARVAGRDPDEHVEVRVGNTIQFRGIAWRYPDFVCRAEAAYGRLRSAVAL